jgi:hypothetical protein
LDILVNLSSLLIFQRVDPRSPAETFSFGPERLRTDQTGIDGWLRIPVWFSLSFPPVSGR